MKIALVTPHFFPKSNAGSARLTPFAEVWAKLGHEVHVFTESLPLEDKQTTQLVSGITIHRTRLGSASNKQAIWLRALKELLVVTQLSFKLLFSKYDLLFASSPPFSWLIFSVLISKLKRKRIVIDVRDPYPEVLFSLNIVSRTSLLGKLLKKLEQSLYNSSLATVSVTTGFCENIRSITHKPVLLCPNGFDSQLFKCADKKDLNPPHLLLFHGNLGRFQDLELLIDYACFLKENHLNQYKIKVVGDGPKAALLQKALEDSTLSPYLDYAGPKALNLIPQIIQEAVIGLSVRTESETDQSAFPVKVYEYLASGVPVIVWPKGEAAEFVDKHNVGKALSQRSVKELHNSVESILKSKDEYAETSKRAVQVASQFDRRKLAADLLSEIIRLF